MSEIPEISKISAVGDSLLRWGCGGRRNDRIGRKVDDMAKIIAVCRSKENGTKKEAMAEGVLREGHGLIGDAHADCCTHRQVSLLAKNAIPGALSLAR